MRLQVVVDCGNCDHANIAKNGIYCELAERKWEGYAAGVGIAEWCPMPVFTPNAKEEN